MANVYLAVARGPSGFNKLLVLKAIREELALQPDLLAMFLDEARLSARLSHPNVVQTLEVSELRGRPVIVMEYLDGQTLSNVLDKPECRDMTLAMRLRVLSTALDGLQYIHDLCDFDGTALQLVHRDVSPHNVFVTYDGQVKLLDFGIAKGIISRARTGTDVIKGKIRYMAPEQMCSEPVDRRADVFSAGVILWEIATGKRIWHGRSEVNVMHAVLNDGVPSPRSVEPSVSAELDRMCMRALARAPADRYETAAALQADVENFLEGMGSRVTPKDVGKYLAKAFAESRALTREIVDAELKKPDDPRDSPSGRFAFPTTLVSLATAGEVGSVEPVAVPPPTRRGWAALVTALAIGVAAGGALILHRPSPRPPNGGTSNDTTPPANRPTPVTVPPPSAPAPASEPPGASAAATLRRVHVQLATTPKNASLFLDGSRVDNPFAGTFAADSAPHAVHAEAPGYAPASTDVVLDRDVNVVLPLAAAKPAASARRPAAAEPTTPAIVAPPAPSSTVATALDAGSYCSPPFYFDAQGIKRLKPECL